MAAPEVAARTPTCRIPKLTYRNRLPPDASSPTSHNPATESTISDTLELRPCASISTLPPTENRPSSDSKSTTSSSSASTGLASSNGSTSRASKSPKKKKNGILGFLTMKEPSQLALEQYAESQRKQAAAKGGPATPVGLQPVSFQKLPSTVPKVNSKWDGIPDSVKSSKSSATSSKRESSSSHSSQPSPNYNYTLNTSIFSLASDASRGPPNSLASPMSSTANFGTRRDSGPSESSEIPPLSSPSTSSLPLPQMTYFFPDSPNSKGALPTTYGEHPWSPPRPPPEVALVPFSFPADEPTPSVNSKAEAIFNKLKGNGGFLAAEAHEVKLGEESDDSDSVPDSHDFLFELPTSFGGACATVPSTQAPRALTAAQPAESSPHSPRAVDPPQMDSPSRGPLTNFSRPRPRPSPFALPHKTGPSSLPTLYEVSVASTDTITELPILTEKSSSRDSDETSIAPSTTKSSDTPASHHFRSHSSRERLGLGGRIRKTEVSPWESQDQPGKPKKGRRRIF